MKPRQGLALAALGLGIVGLFTGGLLCLGSTAGLALAIAALVRARREPERFGGADVAWAAIAANVLALVSIVPLGALVLTLRPLLVGDDSLPEPAGVSPIFGEPPEAIPPPPPPPPPPPSRAADRAGEAGASPRPTPAASPTATAPEGVPVRVGGRIREPRKRVHVNPAGRAETDAQRRSGSDEGRAKRPACRRRGQSGLSRDRQTGARPGYRDPRVHPRAGRAHR
jgi:hypothetical protein